MKIKSSLSEKSKEKQSVKEKADNFTDKATTQKITGDQQLQFHDYFEGETAEGMELEEIQK